MTRTRRFRLTIEFDGTRFRGWQWQPTGERTIQGELQRALAQLPGNHSAVHGAGRTDSGVHALALPAHFDTDSRLDPEKLRLGLNAHLPADVKVIGAEEAAPDFEAQYSCLYRRYVYRLRPVREAPRGLALDRHRVLPVHWRPDVPAMREAAELLAGMHDFASFATRETRSTVRTVLLSELREEHGELRYHVAADGFLRNMIRTAVGTLLWVGRGKLAPEDIPAVIAARDRTRAGHNVAPHGLYFVEAGYAPFERVSSEAETLRRLLF
ncbi:MAG TPA: tRNA pseudouridine(38-40) synthase TruA [Deinococcales bacterium]|nr:tRNA pseudouridine(38-40) synthase TruA [Deinococcales bacterium]